MSLGNNEVVLLLHLTGQIDNVLTIRWVGRIAFSPEHGGRNNSGRSGSDKGFKKALTLFCVLM
jgi:hypothetical protein